MPFFYSVNITETFRELSAVGICRDGLSASCSCPPELHHAWLAVVVAVADKEAEIKSDTGLCLLICVSSTVPLPKIWFSSKLNTLSIGLWHYATMLFLSTTFYLSNRIGLLNTVSMCRSFLNREHIIFSAKSKPLCAALHQMCNSFWDQILLKQTIYPILVLVVEVRFLWRIKWWFVLGGRLFCYSSIFGAFQDLTRRWSIGWSNAPLLSDSS